MNVPVNLRMARITQSTTVIKYPNVTNIRGLKGDDPDEAFVTHKSAVGPVIAIPHVLWNQVRMILSNVFKSFIIYIVKDTCEVMTMHCVAIDCTDPSKKI